jgi:hypothetical protein
LLVLAVIGGPLVAGCSTTTPGSAAPAGPVIRPSIVVTTPNPPAAGYGAPRVTVPLDTTKFQADPCGTLTTAQTQALGIAVPGRVHVSDLGNICQWSLRYNVVYSFGFNVRFDDGEALGLANAYENAGPDAMRRLPDVYGQPAVTDPSQNTGGSCTIYLGATDQIDYAASVQIGPDQPDYQNPCPVAERIADAATATMKSGKVAS